MAIELKLLVVSFMLAAALLQGSGAGIPHVVGDSFGWRVPPAGPPEYVTWAAKQTFEVSEAAKQTFEVGDSLNFNYTTGAHDVAEVSKTAYEGCDSTTPITHATTGPTNITLTPGEHFFICTVRSHCSRGQKLAINVTTNTATSTPPSSAATPLATAALPMIALFSIVLAMLH